MSDPSAATTSFVVAENVADWRGKDVLDEAGEKVGKFEQLFYDGETDVPAFVAIKSGMLGKHVTLVPLSGAMVSPDALRVAFPKQRVKDAPDFDPEAELSGEDEASAYAYFGLAYEPTGSGSRRLAKR